MKLRLANALQLTHPNGNATYVAAAAVTHGAPLKMVSGKVTPCTAATDVAIGVALDDAAADDIVPVALLGNYTGTVTLVAGGALAIGDPVAANGAKAVAGNQVIGRALTAATSKGDLVELAHCVAIALPA